VRASIGSVDAGSTSRRDPTPLPRADGDDESRASGVGALVHRLALDGGPTEREPAARPRKTGDGYGTVHGVSRRDVVGDTDPFGPLRSAHGLRGGAAEGWRRHVELQSGDYERPRQPLGPTAQAHVPFEPAAPRGALIGTRTAGGCAL